MFLRLATFALAWMVIAPAQLNGQESSLSSASQVELIAVRAALAEVGFKPGLTRVVLDPVSVHPDEAPPRTTTGARPGARNEYLARSLGAAAVTGRANVVDCSERPCRLRAVDVVVRISEPHILGDEATITVTTDRLGRRGLDYITNRYRLRCEGKAWIIVSVEKLGIS